MTAESQSNWFTLLNDDYVTLKIEVVDNLPYLHCDVHKWSKESYKHMLHLWHHIRKACIDNDILFMFAWAETSKIDHFARMFGMQPIFEAPNGISLLFMRL